MILFNILKLEYRNNTTQYQQKIMNQQLDIESIMKDFKTFVQAEINLNSIKKQQQKKIASKRQINNYYQSLQKKLKIKPLAQGHKFQNILAPMKKLKTFVSVRQFLRGLHQKNLSQEYNKTEQTKNVRKKLQYQQLRGGLYMQRVQNHLKKYHLKRKLDNHAEVLLKDLQQVQSQKNQYRNWMQNVLGNINLKQEIFITQKQQQNYNNAPIFTQDKNQALILQNLQSNEDKTKKEQQKLKNKQNNDYKIASNYLTQRLKKILTDKFVNNAQRQKRKNKSLVKPQNYNIQNEPQQSFKNPQISSTTRRLVCRTTNTSKRMKKYDANLTNRAKTSDLNNRKPFQDIWKIKVNTKMNNLLYQVNSQYKKSIQNKKQIKLLCAKMQNQNNQINYL